VVQVGVSVRRLEPMLVAGALVKGGMLGLQVLGLGAILMQGMKAMV